jgi:hypothetical protein
MLIAANYTEKTRHKLWAEAVNTANNLENVTANTSRKESQYKLFSKNDSKMYSKMIEFSRLGYVKICRKFSGKWKEKSYKAVMVGYAKDHSVGTYRMY